MEIPKQSNTLKRTLFYCVLCILFANNLFSANVNGASSSCAGSATGSGYNHNYSANGIAPQQTSYYFLASITWNITGGVIISTNTNLNAGTSNVVVNWSNNGTNGNNTGHLSFSVQWGVLPSVYSDPNISPEDLNDIIDNTPSEDSPDFQVAITGVADAGPISGPARICTGLLEVYSTASIAGAASYRWTVPSGWTSNASYLGNNTFQTTSPTITLKANNPTSGQVCVYGVSGSCASTNGASSCMNVSSVSAPVLNLSGNPSSVYVNMPAFQLQSNLAGGIWSGSGITKDGYFNPADGEVRNDLTYTYDNGACKVSNNIVITVNPLGYYMTALTFIGAQGQMVSVPNNAAYNISNDFTIETWVKIPSDASGTQALFANTDGEDDGMAFYINTNQQLALGIQGAPPVLSNVNSGINLFDNTCHYVAVTRENGTITFYMDGQPYGVASGQGNGNNLNVNNNLGYTIGFADGYPAAQPLTGTMDELKYWNVSWNSANIGQYMNVPTPGSTPGLIAYWNFNEGGFVVNDVSSVGNNGILGSASATPPGSQAAPTRVQWQCYDTQANVGLHYDGSTKFATIPSTPYYFGTGAFSFEVWANIETCNSCVKDQILLSSKQYNNTGEGFIWYVRNGTNMVIEFPNVPGGPSGGISFVSDPFPYGWNIYYDEDQGCQNFGVVRDGYGNLTFYIAGVAMAGHPSASGIGDINTANPITVGNANVLNNDGHAYFKGNINEVRIWNMALSGSQVAANLNSQFYNTTPYLVGYWRLKETNGSQVIADGSGTANNGVLGTNSTIEPQDPVRTPVVCFNGGGDRVIHSTSALQTINTSTSEDKNIAVYPNPFNNELTINVGDYSNGQQFEVQLLDASGRMIISKIMTSQSLVIGSDVKPGLYVLKITGADKQSKTFKVVKTE